MKVLVTGIFDLLHAEHIRFLAAAKNQNQKSKVKSQKSREVHLIVGIESDVRVKKLKGEGRPILSQEDRREMLEAMRPVDEVMILPEKLAVESDFEKLLEKISPDVYAVSEESPNWEVKRKICRKLGIEFRIVHPHNPNVSTTRMIRRIHESRIK